MKQKSWKEGKLGSWWRPVSIICGIAMILMTGTSGLHGQTSPVTGTAGYADCPIKFYQAHDDNAVAVGGTTSEAMSATFDADMALLGGSKGLIDFEAFAAGNFSVLPLNSIVLAELVNTGDSVGTNMEGIADGTSESSGLGFNTTAGGDKHLQVYALNDGPTGGVILKFFQPINAFGCYIGGREQVKRDVNAVITYVDGRVQIVTTDAGPYPGGGLQFFGFISDCPIKQVAFMEPYNGEPAGERDIFGIDDIRYATGEDQPPVTHESDCVEFEDLTLGTTYGTGDSFAVSNTDGSLAFDVKAGDFEWDSGTMFAGGQAKVTNGGDAGHIGNEMTVNNINLNFVSTTGSLDGLSVYFGEYGGNINLSVNGDFRNAGNFMDLNGVVLGGVTVAVSGGGLGNDTGALCLFANTSQITSFTIGGQELFIDHICVKEKDIPDPPEEDDCIGFETLTAGTVYGVGSSFHVVNADGSLDFNVKAREFGWLDGTIFAGGEAKVTTGGQAGHVGNEIAFNNINLEFVSNSGTHDGLSLKFGDYGGNINLSVNGEIKVAADLGALHGTIVGGVQVDVNYSSADRTTGEICFSADTKPISSFMIGGQEFFVDRLCPKDPKDPNNPDDPNEPHDDDCIEFEELKLGAEYPFGTSFHVKTGDGALDFDVVTREFQHGDGTMFAGGKAIVENGGMAGHMGNEINVNNINLHFKSNTGSVPGLSILFGEYGGNINFAVNGTFMNVENFKMLDGMVLGGVLVKVPHGGLGNDKGEICLIGQEKGIETFTIGGQELYIDFICPKDEDDPNEPDIIWDFGDLPDFEEGVRRGDFDTSLPDYRTLLSDNGPHHMIRRGLSMPSNPGVVGPENVDPEKDGQPTPDATGDDASDHNDEEGMLFAITHLIVEEGASEHPDSVNVKATHIANVPVENTIGETAFLKLWVDFNHNGSFEDAGDLVAVEAIPGDGSVGDLTISFDQMIHVVGKCRLDEEFILPIRARISTQRDLASFGPAKDGEVVDVLHRVHITTSDWCEPEPEGGLISGFKRGGDIVIDQNLYGPFGLAFNSAGELKIANEGRGGGGLHVSSADALGAVTSLAFGFNGPSGVAYNSAGVLHISDDTNRVFQVAPDGTVTVLIDETNGLNNPNGLAFDSSDNLYVMSSGGFLTKFDTATMSPVIITGGYSNSQGLVIDEPNDRIYVSEESGNIYFIALSGATASSSPGTLFATTGVRTEGGLAQDAAGNIYLSAYDDNKVVVVSPSGVVSDFVTGISQARGLTFDALGALYVTSYDTDMVYRVDPLSGLATLYAPLASTPAIIPGSGLPGWTIYLDSNDNNVLDSDETSTVTDAAGYYEFTGLESGTYNVREVILPGWTQIVPGGPDFKHVINLAPEAVVTGIDFQNRPDDPQVATCVDFEDQTLGKVYNVGDTFIAHDGSGLPAYDVEVVSHIWASGTAATGGLSVVENGGLAGHSGHEMEVNNVALLFIPIPGAVPHGISLHFGEYGGNLNLSVNGDFRNFDNFLDLHGSMVGGAMINVVSGGAGNDNGKLEIKGHLNEFLVGGQELWIDHICPLKGMDHPEPETPCVDFEDQPTGSSLVNGDSFVAASGDGTLSLNASVLPILRADGSTFADGILTVVPNHMAGHLGFELNYNNILTTFVPTPAPLGGVSALFGDYGGHVNFNVNGDLRFANDLIDFNGQVVGGAQVQVTMNADGVTGEIRLLGNINSFGFGGQEFYLDHVCARTGDHPDPNGKLITKHPESLELRVGSTAFFDIFTEISVQDPEIQWLFNEEPIPGANGRSLTIESVTVEHQGEYHAIVKAGDQMEVSEIATLKVNDDPDPDKKLISKQPVSQKVKKGVDSFFDIFIELTAQDAEIQWLFNGEPIEGATSATLALNAVTEANAGEYQARVTSNGMSEFSNIVRLDVESDPGEEPGTVMFGGLVIDGYISNGTVYFDANKNCLREDNEPSTITDAQGNFDLVVDVATFDTNENGVLDSAEGHLVVEGGVDIATGLTNRVKFTGPAGSTVLGPISTLVDAMLASDSSLTADAAVKLVNKSLDIPEEIDTLNYDPFQAASENDPNALKVLVKAAIVQDTVVQLGALVAGASNEDIASGAMRVSQALAAAMKGGAKVDLTDSETLSNIADDVNNDAPTKVEANRLSQALDIIKDLNKQKSDAGEAQGDDAMVKAEAVARIQQVGQGVVADVLVKLGANDLEPEDLEDEEFGDLEDLIANAPVGDILGKDTRPGTLGWNRTTHTVSENGFDRTSLIIERRDGSAGEIKVDVSVIDGTATHADGDFSVTSFTVVIAAGETSRKILFSHIIKDDSDPESDEGFSLKLSLPDGSPEGLKMGERSEAAITVLDNDQPPVVDGEPATLSISRDGITISGTPGARYNVQSSTDLKGWSDMDIITMDNNGSAHITLDLNAEAEAALFFRALPIR